MSLVSRLGRLHQYKNRGQGYAEMLRGSLTPASAVTGLAKYLGVSTGVALTLGALVPVLTLGLAILVGWLDVRYRIMHAHVWAEAEADTWKMRTLTALERGVLVLETRLPHPAPNGYHATREREPR